MVLKALKVHFTTVYFLVLIALKVHFTMVILYRPTVLDDIPIISLKQLINYNQAESILSLTYFESL
jgi:hypothetical protein